MTTYDVRFCSLDLYVLFARHLAALDPFEGLARCHVQVCFEKILILFGCDTGSLKVTRAMTKLVFFDGSIHTLAGSQTINMLVDFAFGVDLLCLHALCDGSCRSNRIFAAKCDKTHLKGCHFCTGTDSHCVSGSCVEWRIPHFMSGKSRIVWFVETGSSACCDQNSFRMDHIGSFFHDGKTDSSVDSSIFRKKVCDVYVVENIYVFTFIYGIRKKWFEVFAIDLNVTVSSCHIVSVFIFKDHETKFFHICRYFVKFFCGCQKEVVSDDSCRIFSCVIYVILWSAAFYNIGVDRVDTCCKTAASFDICLFCNKNVKSRVSADCECGITACSSAAYDQDICM